MQADKYLEDDIDALFEDWRAHAFMPPAPDHQRAWEATVKALYDNIGHDWYFRLTMLTVMKHLWKNIRAVELETERLLMHNRNAMYATQIRFIQSLLLAVIEPTDEASAVELARADSLADGLPAAVHDMCLRKAEGMLKSWPRPAVYQNLVIEEATT